MSSFPRDLAIGEANRRMRAVEEDLRAGVPVGYKAKGYAGKSLVTFTPWFGIFDPDINERPNEGLYVAYICHPDTAAVTLTVQQGTDGFRKLKTPAPEVRRLLTQRADWIRAAIGLGSDPLPAGSFGPGKRQPSYEAGSVTSLTYPRANGLPVEAQLTADLQSMLRVLDAGAAALRSAYGPTWVKPESYFDAPPPPLTNTARFTPKSGDSYTVDIPARTQVKSRLHENVVNDLAKVQTDLGWAASSEHPLDLVLRRTDTSGATETVIVEVKQVRLGDIVGAVRSAIGQLFTYRFQLFQPQVRPTIRLVAAFSEDVGSDLRQLLTDELGIAVLWLEDRRWQGCPAARAMYLVPEAT
jgi:hypothetical protein